MYLLFGMNCGHESCDAVPEKEKDLCVCVCCFLTRIEVSYS